MTDFIAALEEQLVTAHRERRARRFAVPWRGGAVLVAAAATVGVVVALVLALASPETNHPASPRPHTSTVPPTVTKPSRAHPVTVSVLNGTTVTGLARVAAQTLVANGFREGVVTNDTTNQQRARSEIFYEPGHRTEAYAVADCLDIRFDRVLPMDANARVAADRAEVAVFIGADKAK
jgi:hypothetical protein